MLKVKTIRFRKVKMCNLNPKCIAKFDELIYILYILKCSKMLCSADTQSVTPNKVTFEYTALFFYSKTPVLTTGAGIVKLMLIKKAVSLIII